MKLASIKSRDSKNREGEIIVVSKDNKHAVRVDPEICVSLRQAVENWEKVKPQLESTYERLNQGSLKDAYLLDVNDCIAPLPNAAGFYDGSAFLSHVYRARKARGDVMPESAKVTPLMYQGVSDNNLTHNSPIELMDPEFGGDFEGEFFVITSDVPKGTPTEKMDQYMILFGMMNDMTK